MPLHVPFLRQVMAGRVGDDSDGGRYREYTASKGTPVATPIAGVVVVLDMFGMSTVPLFSPGFHWLTYVFREGLVIGAVFLPLFRQFGRSHYLVVDTAFMCAFYAHALYTVYWISTSPAFAGDLCPLNIIFLLYITTVTYIHTTVLYTPWYLIVASKTAVLLCWYAISYEILAPLFYVLIQAAAFFWLISYFSGQRDRANFRHLEEAQAGLKAKTTFLANQNHEMRTLLNGIMGMRELLEDTLLDAQQREALGVIHRCSDSLYTMVCDVLDLEKAMAGKLTLHPAPFAVRSCVEDVCDLVAASATATGVELVCSVDAAVPPRLVGDVTRVKQILLNLVSNAVKFSGKLSDRVGHVHLRAECASSAGTVTFSILDNGIGIAQEHLALLFQPFSQADMSHTRQFQGTGLGLAICKMLAEGIGGTVTVDSTLGVGSTFVVTLPLPPADEPIGPSVGPGDGGSSRRVPGLAAVIASDPWAREAAVSTMRALKWRARAFENDGELEAAAIPAVQYDMILVDVNVLTSSSNAAAVCGRIGALGTPVALLLSLG